MQLFSSNPRDAIKVNIQEFIYSFNLQALLYR